MKKTKRLIYLSIFLAIVFTIVGNSAWASTTFTAINSGNWSDATIWDKGSVPTSVDDVDISSCTVTIDGDYTIDDLTIGSGGVLQPKTTGTYTLTITGNITCTSATPNINGSNSNGKLNIIIDNSTTKTITAGVAYSIEFYNLTLTEGSSITIDNSCKLEGDLTVNNNASLTQSSGTFEVFGTNSTITKASLGTLTFYNLFFAATATNASTASSFTVSKKIEVASSAKFNASAGTITMTSTDNAANPINYNSTTTDLSFNNVTFSASSGTFKPATSFTVKGDMTVSGGVSFYPTAGMVVFDNNASINDPKTITLSDGGTLSFFNLKITDGSNVKTTSNIRIDGLATGGNGITLEGTSSFIATGTSTFYENSSSNIGVTVSNSALLQLNNLTISDPATFYTTSNLVLNGNLTTGSNSSATFASPSIVAFKDTTGATGTKTITNGNSTNTTLMFNHIYVYDDINTTEVKAAANSNTVTLTGDLYVYGGSTMDFSTGTGAVVLMGSTGKTFYNEGTLKFTNLYIENTSGNILNTSSNFTITNDLHALGTASTGGTVNASSPSIITFSKDGDPFVGTNINAHSFYSVKATGAMTAATAGNLLQIKGDLIVGSGGSIDFAGNASTITFNGTSQQKIIGDVTLDEVIVNNSSGLVLEGNLTLGKSSTESSTLTISNGYVDLNGNYYIAFDHYGNALSESSGKVVINSKPGTGYISTASSSYTDINASGIGVSNLTNGENIIVRRYYGVRTIDGIESITRYYRIYSGGSPFYVVGNGIRLSYDESELNGNTEAQLTAYMSANPDAYTYSSDASTTTTSYHNWTHTSATVTTASNYVSLSAADVSSSASFTTGGYFMIAPKFLKIAYFPTTNIDYQNKVAESPLVANSSNKTILGFSLTPTMRIDASSMQFTALNVNFSRSPSGIFSNFEIYKDQDADLSNYAYGSAIASGSLSGNTVQFASLGQTFTAGQTEYYFIVADVDATVNSSTPSIYAYIDQDGITMNNIYKKTQTINGPTYSFGALNVTLSSANSPSAGALDIGTTDQTIYGFKLTPPANASVTFNTVNIKVTVANGAEYNDFENWKLYADNNKNGIYDGDDTQVGSTISAINETTGILSYTASSSLVAGEDNNYILVTSVKTDANADGTLKAQITSYSDVTLESPATIPSGGPYEGNTMTVRSSSGTPTRLSITAFSMKDINGNSGRDYDLKAKGENEVVVNKNLVIQVKAVDDNGRPQKVSQATTVTLTPLGGGTVTNNTLSMSINTTTVKGETLTFSTASTSNQFSLVASTTAGQILIPDTLTGITVYSLEPTSFFTGLSISSIEATTANISWTNSSSEQALVVMKAGGWPAAPEDGVDYNASSNFSSPASTNGTTGTGSVVVYEGTGSSVNLTGLSANTTYYVVVYKYTGSGIGTNYLTWDLLPSGTYNSFNDRTQFTTKYAEPTAISSNMTFTNLTSSSMKITWTKPSSGGGTYSLVVIGTADPSTTPTDTNTYTASTNYGEGSPLGTGSTVGYVVYNGTGNSVTVNGLSFDTRYYVRVYEYNGSSGEENYLTSQYLSSNRYTLDKEPEIQASNLSFSDMVIGSNTSLTLRWVRGNGDKVLVVGKAGSAITDNETPDDQSIAYTSESSQSPTFGSTTAIGQGYALYYGTANTITVSGLQYGQTYYFKVFEYNEGSGTNTTVDNSTLNYNTDDATNNPNSRLADSYEPNDDLSDAKFINSDGTLYSGLLTSEDDVDWFSFRPDFENGYDNIRIKLTGLPKNYTLELYRADGRLLRRSKIVGTSDEIVVLNNLPEADYYIKIYSADGEYSLTPYRVYVLHRTSGYNSDTQ